MGLKIVLESESGEKLDQVSDLKNVLHRILPSVDDSAYSCIRFIDWYGDTVFNRLQMDTFLDEWRRIGKSVRLVEEKELLSQVANLATRCQQNAHLYLKFYGD